MKGDFFEQFKNYLLNNHKDNISIFIPYYETLLQAKDCIKELLNDADKYYLEIRYEEDKHDGYTEGEFEFYFYTEDPNQDYGCQSCIDHYYKMELLLDQRHWGYCDCTPEMEIYNPVHGCCGNGCDWTAPEINVTKINNIIRLAFEGQQRDLWELEKKWKEDKVDHEEELRKKRLEQIEQRIRELEVEKNKINKVCEI